MKKKTIILIGLVDLDAQTKGESKHFSLIVKYLSQKFNTYTITVSNTKENTDKQYYLKYKENKWLRNWHWNKYCYSYIRAIQAKETIDLIYTRAPQLYSVYLSAKVYEIKIGLEVNGWVVHNYSNKVLALMEDKLYCFLFRNVTFFTASKGYIHYLQEFFDIPKEKTVSLRLGHSGQVLNIKKQKALKNLALSSEFRYFIFIGKILNYYGLDLLLETVFYFQDIFRKQQFKILIVGNGPDKENLTTYTLKNKLTDLIEFREPAKGKQFEYYLNIGAIGLSLIRPNRAGKGARSLLKTFDYLFHKMPIITSSMDEMAVYINENGYGSYINEFTKEEVLRLMKLMVQRQDEIQQNYLNSFEEKVAHFTWENRFTKIAEGILAF